MRSNFKKQNSKSLLVINIFYYTFFRQSYEKITFPSGVDQLLDVNQHLRETPKRWQTPLLLHVFVRLCFLFSLFSSISDGKSCISFKKFILTSKRRAEHPLAVRNTQQTALLGEHSVMKFFYNRSCCCLGRKAFQSVSIPRTATT